MDNTANGKSQFVDEEAQFMIGELKALSENRPDIEDSPSVENTKGVATAEELIEVANDPDPNWYEVAMSIIRLFDVNYDEFLFHAESPCSVWVEWSDENHLPTETILKHMEVFFQLSVLRNIPPQKYEHLSPEGAQSILKPLLPDEPTVPATSCKISCPVEFVLQWWKWETRLLSALKDG